MQKVPDVLLCDLVLWIRVRVKGFIDAYTRKATMPFKVMAPILR